MSDKRSEGKSISTAGIKREMDNNTRKTRSVSSTNIKEVGEQDNAAKFQNEVKKLRSSKINQDDRIIVREETSIRGYNVPENILIVFDRVKDEMETNFFDCGDRKITPRQVMHRVIRLFVHNKIAVNDKHSFAVMALNERDCSLSLPKFTRNPQIVEKTLQKLMDPCDTEDIFSMNLVFDTILARHGALIRYDISKPDSVYRVIFCYGRSFTKPDLHLTPEIRALLEASNFFFDVVFTHEARTVTSSHQAEIFKLFQTYDRKDVGYLFSIERNLRAAHLAMARLLAHPLQRPPFQNTYPCLSPKDNDQSSLSKEVEKEDHD